MRIHSPKKKKKICFFTKRNIFEKDTDSFQLVAAASWLLIEKVMQTATYTSWRCMLHPVLAKHILLDDNAYCWAYKLGSPNLNLGQRSRVNSLLYTHPYFHMDSMWDIVALTICSLCFFLDFVVNNFFLHEYGRNHWMFGSLHLLISEHVATLTVHLHLTRAVLYCVWLDVKTYHGWTLNWTML